jgi:hypothetical protein
MSTRAQVKVVAGGECGGHEDTAFTLYHHCDGYPSNMLPLMLSAFAPDWKHERPGKAAAFLCGVDPGGFEPEQGHELHGDIEWYYVLHVTAEQWTVEVFECDIHMTGPVTLTKKLTRSLLADAIKAIPTLEA